MSFQISFTPSGSIVPTLIEAITTAGLTANLELALDAGDSNSYSGSGQKWLDTSGNGYDFFRGTDGSASTDDPTFNGSAGGKSDAEYWSFDGGDFFTYDTTIEAWMNNMHKDNFTYSYLCGLYPSTPATFPTIFGTGNAGAERGMYHQMGGPNKRTPLIFVRDNTDELSVAAGGELDNEAWNILGGSFDESGGSVSFHYLNGSLNISLFDAALASSVTGAAANVLKIGARGDNVFPLAANMRMGFIAFWSVALTEANLDTLYSSLKGRFGL